MSHMDFENHLAPECFGSLYWSQSLLCKYVRNFDHMDEICEQLWAERRIMRTPKYQLTDMSDLT